MSIKASYRQECGQNVGMSRIFDANLAISERSPPVPKGRAFADGQGRIQHRTNSHVFTLLTVNGLHMGAGDGCSIENRVHFHGLNTFLMANDLADFLYRDWRWTFADGQVRIENRTHSHVLKTFLMANFFPMGTGGASLPIARSPPVGL